jgi:hypothetical protein
VTLTNSASGTSSDASGTLTDVSGTSDNLNGASSISVDSSSLNGASGISRSSLNATPTTLATEAHRLASAYCLWKADPRPDQSEVSAMVRRTLNGE